MSSIANEINFLKLKGREYSANALLCTVLAREECLFFSLSVFFFFPKISNVSCE